ncbi:MAG: hypothetical protein ABFC24_09295 [Methanoregulaceae archaeon]
MDGVRFEDPAACPACGGQLTGHDWISRTFATVREDGADRDITVRVKRFSCTSCGKISSAAAPFYPGTRIGAPVIDLCVVLKKSMPVSRIAAYLAAEGVVLDRGSCRNYARKNFGDIPVIPLFGTLIPSSVFSLSLLAGRLPEGGTVKGAEALRACGFPSADRAGPDRTVPPQKRDEREEQEEEEERKSKKVQGRGNAKRSQEQDS